MNPQPFVEETRTIDTFANDEWQTLSRIIQRRRSIRRYTDEPIRQELLMALLEAATWAPSAHNRQPWRFCVVTSAEVKIRLSVAMGEQWRADLTADDVDPALIERRVAISHTRMTSAAALVVASLTRIDMDRYPDPIRAQAEWAMTVQSVALACQNLLLAAEAHGIGACWMCAPLFVPDLVRRVLELPADWEAQALITLGYPTESKQKERAPLASRVLWR
jgi:F420 biosynthesis protein FbiB-like protein